MLSNSINCCVWTMQHGICSIMRFLCFRWHYNFFWVNHSTSICNFMLSQTFPNTLQPTLFWQRYFSWKNSAMHYLKFCSLFKIKKNIFFCYEHNRMSKVQVSKNCWIGASPTVLNKTSFEYQCEGYTKK